MPLTIGRTYALLTLTIRLGILSFALPLLWWLRCWRDIFVIVSISELNIREEPCTGILSVEPSQLSEYLSRQVQKAADYLASPLLGVTELLHIGHVVTGNIKIFCPHTMPSSRLSWHIVGYTFSIHFHSSLASVG